MDTLACVDFPALPLQIILRRHPDWRDDPTVVVEDDRPLARILWANRSALRHRIYRGMKFAQAQSLTARLRAAVVSPSEINQALRDLLMVLLDFSPRVEPMPDWPGLFWLDPNGLRALFGSFEDWAARVHRDLAQQGWVAAVVVGRNRGSLFAIARSCTGPVVFRSATQEKRAAAQVPLARLQVSPKLCEAMAALGITTLGEFLALPVGGLGTRYGAEAAALHELASGVSWAPLQAAEVVQPVRAELQIDPPDSDQTRLLFGIKSTLHGVVAELAQRCQALTALQISLELDHAAAHREWIESASPTLDVVQLIELVRLRLDALELVAAVEKVVLDAESVRVHPEQIALLRVRQRRDLEAAARAIARVKAAFGPDAITRAQPVAACLPEARFRWQPISTLLPPHPQVSALHTGAQPLVRRFCSRPVPLPAPPRQETERWLGLYGAVLTMSGPGRVSGGWWQSRVERDYYWIETRTGEILWAYFDKERRRWFLHGVVD